VEFLDQERRERALKWKRHLGEERKGEGLGPSKVNVLFLKKLVIVWIKGTHELAGGPRHRNLEKSGKK